ncbi:MAG TPA: FAD-dependent oxidoreductase [Alphaproteobacteria bacterium]|nr:FAD-dependent oxidoreductase [Alphaproteobacteria bacterium]
MRPSLAALDHQSFDVAVIGAGVNGASAAQTLAAAGYSVLLVDKGDFASGSSSRSSRLLHCGLRYLAPGSSMWEFVRHPDRLAVALRMARQAMAARSQFVTTTPERARSMKFCFPIYKGGPYATWQVDLAFRILKALGSKEVPLDYRRLDPGIVRGTPLLQWLRDQERLSSVAMFREYQFEWPERICMDAILDAERMGAVVRNYTAARRLERVGDKGWRITLRDELAPEAEAAITAKVVLNMAGIWIDRVNAQAGGTAHPRRKITGTKGVHIMIRLPPECQDYGIATLNRLNEGFYCVPWRGMHYFGPTETLYEGDLESIRPLEEEIKFLLDEANYLLPALKLKRDDVIFAWAGVRPLTYDEALLPQGKRSREIHDLGGEGMPDVFALTAGPIMTHRSAGEEIARVVARRIAPSRPAQALSYAAHLYPDNQNSPTLLDDDTTVKLADLRAAAAREHVTNLADLLFRRTGAGWTATMGAEAATRAAEAVADLLGWDQARIAREVASYREYLARNHLPASLR